MSSKETKNIFIKLLQYVLAEYNSIKVESHIKYRLLNIPKIGDTKVSVQVCGKFGKYNREISELIESGDILYFPTLDVIFITYVKAHLEIESNSCSAGIGWLDESGESSLYQYRDYISGQVTMKSPDEIINSTDIIRLTKSEIKNVSYKSGFDKGYGIGFQEGYLKGHDEGFKKGYNLAKVEDSLKNEHKWKMKGTWSSDDNVYFELYSTNSSRNIIVDITNMKSMLGEMCEQDVFEAGVRTGQLK